MNLIRLNKYLAERGIASRRKADELIAKGLVKVNGILVAELGFKVDPIIDKIEFDNDLLDHEIGKLVYLKVNKPYGYECSKNAQIGDDGSAKSLYDLVDKSLHLFSIGRLDKESEGLILMTNDGRLAYQLTHPSFCKEKEYEVTVDRNIEDKHLKMLSEGVKILGRRTARAKVKRVSQRKFNIIITEGMNRQIRRMCRKFGYRVHKLKRLRVGEIVIGDLQSGQSAHLSGQELKFVKKILS